jgi:hypothetical protein
MKVVGRWKFEVGLAVLSHMTVMPEKNPFPFTVSMNAGPPAPTSFGMISSMHVEHGGGGALFPMVKVMALEAAVPGL